MSRIRFGIVGMGNMGSVYAALLRDGEISDAELTAVCDVDQTRLSKWSTVAGFQDVSRLLSSDKIDAVVVCTPHYDHVSVGTDALKAGLHVVIDKPIAPTKLGAETLLQAPVEKGQIFAAMFNQRTDPRYIRLRKMIREGELGRIQRMSWIITDWFRTDAYYASGGWRATWKGEGGGVLLNQSPHQLDLWQWLFGMPCAVRAFCGFGRYHDIEVEDDVTAYLQYPDGANGVFITTTGEAPGTNRLEVAADRGRVIVEGDSFEFIRNTMGRSEYSRTASDGFGRPEAETIRIEVTERGEQHAGILRNVVAAINGEADLISPATDGIHSVELANAMIYSGLKGETVQLPLDSLEYEQELGRLVARST